MDMDHFLWADFRAGTTANAFLLIHFRHTILIDGNGSEFTFIYTGFTSDTSICTAGLTFG
jgi:flavorubredoxin